MQEFAEGLPARLIEFIDGGRDYLVAREQVRTRSRPASRGHGRLVVRRGRVAPRTKSYALPAIQLGVARGQEQKFSTRKFAQGQCLKKRPF